MFECSECFLKTLDGPGASELPGRILKTVSASIKPQQRALLSSEIDSLPCKPKVLRNLFRGPSATLLGQKTFAFPHSTQASSCEWVVFGKGFDCLPLFEGTNYNC